MIDKLLIKLNAGELAGLYSANLSQMAVESSWHNSLKFQSNGGKLEKHTIELFAQLDLHQ